MKRVILSVLIVTTFLIGNSFAQEFAKVGTAGAQFLKIGIGARGVAMSDAYSAVCNDASSIFWNPAGLTHVENNSALLSHAEWLADINYEAAAYAKNIRNVGVIGVSFAILSSGDMEETTVQQQGGTGRMFNTSDFMVGISYAKQLSDKFSIGGNLKYIREKLDAQEAWAWAIDIGTLYYTGFRSLRMGMYIRNFGPELKIDGTYNDYDNGGYVLDATTQEPEDITYLPYHMPMTFAVGIAYDILEDDDKFLTAAIDLLHPNDNVEKLNFGAEFRLFNMLSLRAGYVSPFDILGRADEEIEERDTSNEYSLDIKNYTQSVSAGLGLMLNLPTLGNFSLDYAYTDFGVLDWVHRGSITINF